jgi:hypothetical protein
MNPDLFERTWRELCRRRRNRLNAIEQRILVIQRIFQDDLIKELSAADVKLIEKYYGTGDASGIKVMPTERVFQIGRVKPCSPAVRDRLDRAVGRYVRMYAQRITAEEWLKRAPFDVKSNRRAILKALNSTDKPAPLSSPGRGRRADLAKQVEGDIRAELDAGTITLEKLGEMKLKEIGERYHCAKDTAHKVKKSILNSQK